MSKKIYLSAVFFGSLISEGLYHFAVGKSFTMSAEYAKGAFVALIAVAALRYFQSKVEV